MTRSIFIAVPCYAAPETQFIASLRRLERTLAKLGMRYAVVELTGESLISRARNRLIAIFEASDFTDFLFLDSDLVFEPADVLRLVQSEHGLCAAPYPAKAPGGRLIGNPVGVQGASGGPLQRVVKDGFVLAQDLPTGFMLIRRATLERIAKETPEVDDDMPGSSLRSYRVYFDTAIDGRQYLSEDWFFTRLARACGVEAWLDTRAKLGHVGRFMFTAPSFEEAWGAADHKVQPAPVWPTKIDMTPDAPVRDWSRVRGAMKEPA